MNDFEILLKCLEKMKIDVITIQEKMDGLKDMIIIFLDLYREANKRIDEIDKLEGEKL